MLKRVAADVQAERAALRLGLCGRPTCQALKTAGLERVCVCVQAQVPDFADVRGAQSGTGLLSQPTVLGQANQVLHPEAGPYAPGQNLLPGGNLRTVDFGGSYNNGVYNLSLLSVQENEIKGASLSVVQLSSGLPNEFADVELPCVARFATTRCCRCQLQEVQGDELAVEAGACHAVVQERRAPCDAVAVRGAQPASPPR